MVEEKPVELPVSEQEVQIEAPSLLEKIQAQKKKILIGLGSFLGVLILAGAVFGTYKYVQRQIPLVHPEQGRGEPTEGPTPTPTQGVTIATDKTEYVQGETVKITVRNVLSKTVWRSGECGGILFWGLQKLENGEWKWLDFSLPYLEKGKEICDFILCERVEPVEFKSDSELSYDWRLSICEWPEKPIGVPKTEPKRIGEGTYRISFTYGLNKEGFNLLEEKTIYSTFKFLEEENPAPSPANIEKITYKPISTWQTYTDSRENFSVQYPQDYKFGGTEELNGIYFVYLWSCVEKGGGEEPLCMSGYDIQVHYDYDGGSRRAWLLEKFPSMGNLYIEEVEVQGIKSLILMDGNTGGSTGSVVGIPKGTKMYVFGFPGGWNPDTKEKPSLDFIKQVLSTFKFLD